MKVRYLWIAAVCCILAACKFTGTSNVELIVSPESKIIPLSEARDQVHTMRASGEQGDIDENSIVADPLFIDHLHGDSGFKTGSPAIEMGIDPLPGELVHQMGTLNDPFLKRFVNGVPMHIKHTIKTTTKHYTKD